MTWFEKSIFKIILYWLSIFFIGRLFFIAFNYSDLESETLFSIIQTFYYGIRMDLSAIAYINTIPVLFLFILYLTKRTDWVKAVNWYLILTTFVYFIIITSELSIYTEWHTKLNVKAISYLKNINEVWSTASATQVLISFIFVPLFTIAFLKIVHAVFVKAKNDLEPKFIRSSGVMILTIGIFFIFARGGVSGTSLSISSAFFSPSSRTLNYSAVNSYWHLIYNVYKHNKYSDKDKFKYMSAQKAEALIASVKPDLKGEQEYIFKTKRPNVIVVLLESWSADLVDSLHVKHKLTPKWNDVLRNEGLYFDRCYSSGVHSEEGIISVFSGFPGLSSSYIMSSTEKVSQLPSIFQEFKKENYTSAFYFGGDLSYANISSYFYSNPFQTIVDEKTFPTKYPKGSLNYHDEFLYTEMLNATSELKEPFFLGGFTGSTHSPYDIPTNTQKEYGRMSNYLNSANYADSCLWSFYNEAKKEAWYDNTIFIFVADHSHATPVQAKFGTKETFRIPFLIAGGALKEDYKGEVFDKVVSQNCIPALVLGQMDIASDAFVYSSNPFMSDYFPYANYAEKQCVGSVSQNSASVLYFDDNKVLNENVVNRDSLILPAKALLQKAYLDYLSK